MADVEALLGSLTLEEKAALTAGEGMFHTPGVERLGIPSIQVTDGPSGARGLSYPGLGGPSSTCIPCGSAIGATWDPALAEELGALVARDAFDRGCRGLLAPTVNLHRSPLAGRNFECYSEDPLLSGKLAAGYVRGVQSEGVFATVKHLVCNDAEFERFTISSEVDQRTMRELYLVPFEIAVKEGGALAVMCSYNRVNGRWVTQQPELLTGILREEWGFEGLVMTDWFATVDTESSLRAGLDLEMPGPGRSFGAVLVAAVEEGRVDESDLDAALRRLLGGYDRIGALDGPAPPLNPRPPGPEDTALLRQGAAEAIVLLSNDGVLPLDPGSLRRVAVLGPRADDPCLNGGGSARVILHKVVSPLAELRAAFGETVEVVHARGCEADRSPRVVGGPVLHAPDGFEGVVHVGPGLTGELFGRKHLDQLRVFVFSSGAQEYPEGPWSMRVRGTVVPEEDGVFQLALGQAGRARVFVDGELVLDGVTDPPPPGGSDFFGLASQDMVSAERTLTKGKPVELVVEYDSGESPSGGFRVGFRSLDGDTLMERAVAAAAEADAAVLVVGTSDEWETEGNDRAFFALPGRQAELIEKVAAANARTVVVVNAAGPVDMAWADGVAAVLQSSFGGEEMAVAVADVLTGRSEPGGRLPTTIPERIEHSPSYDNFPGEGGELRYGEGVFMGYRGYEHRRIAPCFPFGHGLSYSSFEFGEPSLSISELGPADTLTVSVAVTNTGRRAGSEVVQCYVAPVAPRLARPPKELKAFAKLRLQPGETEIAELVLEERAFSCWDPGDPDWDRIVPLGAPDFFGRRVKGAPRPAGWRADAGEYDVLVGRSSAEILATRRVRWTGDASGAGKRRTGVSVGAEQLRVVQWATGNIGLRSLRAVIEHPDLELVGLYVYSEAKEGRDAGELCGVGPIGVRATRQVDDIMALRPDCVLYMGDRTDVDLLCRLLESGANVVSTRSDLHHAASMDPGARERLEAACRTGGSSLHSTGSSPGFITEALPLVLTSLERRLDRLTIEEYADMSSRNSPEMLFGLMGFGAPPDAFDPGPRAQYAGGSFAGSLNVLADTIGLPLDGVDATAEVALARQRVEIAAGAVEEGTVAAQRMNVVGRRDGRPLLEFRATWYVTADLDPAWDLRDTGWRVQVAGDLPLDVEIHFPVPDEEWGATSPNVTAHRPVNAVRAVCAADPGILTIADLPNVVARLG